MGAHVGKGPAELGAYLIPLQYDSKEGYSTGGLLEGSLGILGGAKEWMWNWSQWKSTGSWLGLIGERAKLPGTRAGLGVVDAGFFGDSHGDAGGYLTVDGMGGGAYANSSCGS
jgi:hypothetical protein